MKKAALLVLVLASTLALGAPGAVAAQAPYTVIATTTTEIGPLVRTDWAVVPNLPDPLARFTVTRLVKDVPPERLRGSILFLPSLGTTFSLYEQRDASGAIGTSIAEFFALRNYDVYGYSPRFEGIPAGTCEAGVVDCSGMAGWNLQSMVEDVAFVRSWIETLHPGSAVVTGGVSLGGILAFAVANDAPDDYLGIFPWEGMLATPDPSVQALNQGYCAALEAQLAGGIVFDGFSGGTLARIVRHAQLAPGGLTPIPLFPPFLTNHQVLVAAVSVPTPGPVSMPVPGYVAMAGSLAEDRLFFASEERLAANVDTFSSYVPTAVVRDISCSLAGIETAYVSNLGAFTGSVLAIGGGKGFGAFMDDNLALLGSSDVTFLLEPEFGHIDHFMTLRHREVVERPILRWLRGLMP